MLSEFVKFFSLQFISYLNLVLNFRAIDTENTLLAILTDGLAGLMAWTLVKKIGSATTKVGILGLVTGGMAATYIAMLLTASWE